MSGKRELPEWQYVAEGWKAAQDNPDIKGWNVASIADIYKRKWPGFLNNLEGTAPLAFSPEAIDSDIPDLSFHNAIMSYAYALATAARQKPSISMLDWGGAIGHYLMLSRKLFPELGIDYHCRDLPLLVEYGRELFPEAFFYSDDSCLQRSYDFVLSSSSLQYSEDWSGRFASLANATAGHMFITLLPVVMGAPAFVMVQRPYKYGYNTEYLGWCLNREELLERAREEGLELQREFMLGVRPQVVGAPGQCEYRGFLFRTTGRAEHRKAPGQ